MMNLNGTVVYYIVKHHRVMLTNFKYHSDFVFRTPLVPLNTVDMSRDELFDYSKQPFFKEAIYLASPVLYDQLDKWHKNEIKETKEIEKLVVSLYKYYTRMQSRCTPYGLFASCSVGTWGETTRITIDSTFKRHTRLDMNYLCALAQKLNSHPAVFPLIRFYPNNSIYRFGDQIRFIEYTYLNNRRIHQISSIENNDYLEQVIKSSINGASVEEITMELEKLEVERNEINAFLQEIINCQLLVSELEPAVTGTEFIYQILDSLKQLNSNKYSPDINFIISVLESAQRKIAMIDENVGNDSQLYRDIYSELEKLNASIEENQLFQTDLYRPDQKAQIDSKIQTELLCAIQFLNKLFSKEDNQNLNKFKENYYSQYEEKEMPLLEVLDIETGIGYAKKDASGINSLIDDLRIAYNEELNSDFKWNKHQEFLHSRLLKAIKNNDFVVKFDDADLNDINYSASNLPDTLPVVFRLLSDNKVFLQNCGGSSAANLLGRFGHGDNTIKNLLHDITAYEQERNPEIVFAEIVHLPESRIGNILLRPTLREYEIPYLGKSALPANKQINLQDLMVSVKNNQVVLRSKFLNKEIVPRLSTAHNYSFNSLPVYQFLCDLQTQYYEKHAFGFNWGVLKNNFKFLPRTQYRNIILKRATWQLTKNDCKKLTGSGIPSTDTIKNWRDTWNIPKHVVFVEGDNELLVDFENSMSVNMFLSVIKNKDSIELEEFLFDKESLVVMDPKGSGYTNEIIGILLKTGKGRDVETTVVNSKTTEGTIPPRDFSIGSEWLYYKFYCGVKTADKLLAYAFKPLCEELISCELIDKYFFIRYFDPEPHIRLRFHLIDVNKIGLVISKVKAFTENFFNQGFISKIQTDTYKREVERYGPNSIDLAEDLFHHDSKCCLGFVDLLDPEQGNTVRWQFAIRSLDQFLSDFCITLESKHNLLNWLSRSFFLEHGGKKELKIQLDDKFRKYRREIEDLLNTDMDAQKDIYPLIELLETRSKANRIVFEKIQALYQNSLVGINFNELLGSYIHMMMNRIFLSKQRTNEFVVYDILHRYYKSELAKNKTKNILVTT